MPKISIIESLQERIRKLEVKRLILINQVCELKKQYDACENESEKITIEYAMDSLTADYEEVKKVIGRLDQDLNKLIKNQKKVVEGKDNNIFTPFNFSELLNQPPKEWLVENLFGKGDLGLVYGSPGCGKTFVVIDLIFALCQAGQWAGSFGVNRPLSVAYCAGEGFSGLPARFAAAAANLNVLNMPSFSFFKQIPQLFDSSFIPETIDRFIKDWSLRQQKKEADPLDVLIIDTFHTAIVGADENSSGDMAIIIHACRKAIEKLDCVVIMVHHTTKDGSVERGSGALRGNMDFMIKVEKIGRNDSNQGRMSCEKNKDGPIWKSQNFELIRAENQSSCHVQWDSPLPSDIINQSKINQEKFRISQIMSQNPNVGFTVKSLSEALDLFDEQIRRSLSEMLDAGAIERKLQHPEKNSSSRNPWLHFLRKP